MDVIPGAIFTEYTVPAVRGLVQQIIAPDPAAGTGELNR